MRYAIFNSATSNAQRAKRDRQGTATNPLEDGMTPRRFALVVGIALLLIGGWGLFGQVEVTHRGEPQRCGTASEGLSSSVGNADAGREIAAAIYGTEPRLVGDDCKDAIGVRQAWSWPVAGVGALVALGAAVIRTGRATAVPGSESGPERP